MTRNKNLMTHPSVADISKLSDWYHPSLNKYDPDSISSKSVVICWWICGKGHLFERSPNTVLNSSKPCTECHPYRRVVAGVNDLTTTHPEVAKNFSKNNTFPVTSYSKGHKKSVLWQCENGHEYSQEVYIEVRPESGCPVCSRQRIILGINDLDTIRADIKSMWSVKNPPLNSFTMYSVYEAIWLCVSGHEFKAKIRSMFKRIDLCHECPKSIPFEDSVASSERHMRIWSNKNSVNPRYLRMKSHQIVTWFFSDCQHEVEYSIKQMTKRDSMCPTCTYAAGSSQEEFLAGFLVDRYNVKIEQRVRILGTKEIDVYIPLLLKGVEFNGERWHCDAKAIEGGFVDSIEMHQWKLDKADDLGIDLVFVWAHDWTKHREKIVKCLDSWFVDNEQPDPILLRCYSLADGKQCTEC